MMEPTHLALTISLLVNLIITLYFSIKLIISHKGLFGIKRHSDTTFNHNLQPYIGKSVR